MSYEEIHKASRFNVGDMVKVFDKSFKGQNGWKLSWTHTMTTLIGEVGQIKKEDVNQGFLVEFNKDNEQYAIYWFPCFVLSLSSDKKSNMNFTTPVKTISDYPHQCPHCGGPAYVGIFKIDCKRGCK